MLHASPMLVLCPKTHASQMLTLAMIEIAFEKRRVVLIGISFSTMSAVLAKNASVSSIAFPTYICHKELAFLKQIVGSNVNASTRHAAWMTTFASMPSAWALYASLTLIELRNASSLVAWRLISCLSVIAAWTKCPAWMPNVWKSDVAKQCVFSTRFPWRSGNVHHATMNGLTQLGDQK